MSLVVLGAGPTLLQPRLLAQNWRGTGNKKEGWLGRDKRRKNLTSELHRVSFFEAVSGHSVQCQTGARPHT